MKTSEEQIATIVFTIVCIMFVVVVLLFVYNFYLDSHPKIYEFELSELESGVYAYREEVVSAIPAQNYTMTTVRDTSGNVFTIKGSLSVVNTETEKPHAVWTDKNIVNADSITIYAPAKSVVYIGAVTVRQEVN